MKRLCSVLLLAVAGCGGVEVRGIVRDQMTGDPLPGATVRVGEEETQTDYRGFYELEADEDEANALSVDKSGYESWEQEVSFEGVDQLIQDVELNPQLPGSEGGIMAPGGLDRLPSEGGNVPPDEMREPTAPDEGLPEEEGGDNSGRQRGMNQGGMNGQGVGGIGFPGTMGPGGR